MDINQLLLPVLSGYLLLTRSNILRYRMARLSGYHLLFSATLVGFTLLLAALWIKPYLGSVDTTVDSLVSGFVPAEHVYCMAESILLIVLGNVFYWPRRAAYSALRSSGSDIELVLAGALQNNNLVEITQKSRKVYTGIVVECNLPTRKESAVGIIPVLSGFRSSESLEVKYLLNYSPILRQAVSNSHEFDLDARMKVVVPYDELASVRPFDPQVYRAFESTRKQADA